MIGIFFIIFCCMMIGIYIGYKIGSSTSNPNTSSLDATKKFPSPTSQIQTSPTMSNISNHQDWLVYTNTLHNYSFKYPSDFAVEELEAVVCPTPNPIEPPSTPGCISVKNKGDKVIIYNRFRDSRNDISKFSQLTISYNDSEQKLYGGCVTYPNQTDMPYKKILINNSTYYESMMEGGRFEGIISSYVKIKGKGDNNNDLYCENRGIFMYPFTLDVFPNNGGVAAEDNIIMEEILQTLTF